MSGKQEQNRYDFSGLKCPLPVLKTRRALKDIKSGQIITICADDPAAPLDMAHFCETEGHILLSSDTQGDVTTFIIQKAR